ncbi:MAG: hypothetical protein LLF98_02655 [Clostridium sp.]|uniref:hypothetical protein n=1 Tax=Clostridium sp. TaxID=1506 RepID=UPI0025BBB956|nr:hypothetical protein [Clostridium sp.]MCE5220184.1 hypothetical protein [Clostridium sp.]
MFKFKGDDIINIRIFLRTLGWFYAIAYGIFFLAATSIGNEFGFIKYTGFSQADLVYLLFAVGVALVRSNKEE